MSKKKRIPPQEPAHSPASLPIADFLTRYSRALAAVLVLVATVRIAATYSVFSHTYDEPAHIACGVEWLDKGVYTWEPQHPPLARLAVALGPYLTGAHSQRVPSTDGNSEMTLEGLRILYRGHEYDRNLLLARLGVLPFFWLACWVVYAWARRVCGSAGAVLAVWVFTFVPPVLAHAGVATTDMAVTAFLGAAFLAGAAWSEDPSWQRALWFALATAGGVLSKFSFLAFFPVVAALSLGAWYLSARPSAPEAIALLKARAPSFLAAVLVASLAILAGYRFSWSAGPAPELFQGIQDVAKHNREGHIAYLLGERSKTGFLLFFPITLAVKTPLAVLLLAGLGMLLAIRARNEVRQKLPLLFAFGVLAVGMWSSINIGVRHILPVYLALSICAAAALLRLLEFGSRHRGALLAAAAAVAWLSASSLLSHPDYLAYFNELVLSKPEQVLADSDLDWGQDVKRLGQRLRAAGAPYVVFTQFALGDLAGEQGFPRVLTSAPHAPSPGWNAVSVSIWKKYRMRLLDTHPELALWPDRIPERERIGKSILLWYFPGDARN